MLPALLYVTGVVTGVDVAGVDVTGVDVAGIDVAGVVATGATGVTAACCCSRIFLCSSS